MPVGRKRDRQSINWYNYSMLSQKTVDDLVHYWLDSSQEKYKTMKGLYKIKRYADCLFFGHLILEKILKAHVVQKTKDHAPRTHNLVYLVELAKLTFNKKERNTLADVDTFNMTARYPDQKLLFYKKCNKKFTDQYYYQIEKLYKDLCQSLQPKK